MARHEREAVGLDLISREPSRPSPGTGTPRLGRTRALWGALSPVGRLALAGVLASAVAAIALGITITSEIRRQLLDAEGRGLQAAVSAIEPSLDPFRALPLSRADVARLDAVVAGSVLGGSRVRAKLWTLDGTIAYSDAPELIGRSFPEVRERLTEAVDRGVVSAVTDLDELENEFERAFSRLIEFYVPVRDPDGQVVGVLEIYEDVRFLDEAIGRVSLVTWAAIGSGLAVLTLFLGMLVAGTLRSIMRDRRLAEARAAELGVLVEAMDALSSSLEPVEIVHRLEHSVRDELGMSRLAIEPGPPDDPTRIGVPLRDGSWLVATTQGSTPTTEDARVLNAVGDSLDTSLANASLFAQVRAAAEQRRELLRQIAVAHDDERHRIVGELHDTLAGDLIRILYGIRGIASRSTTSSPEITAEIARLEGMVADTERNLRGLMGRVRPVTIAPGGLVAALEEVASRERAATGIDIRLRTRGTANALPAEAQTVLLRATEEALMNVRKHASARRVIIHTVDAGACFRLSVDDDGCGWADHGPWSSGHGLGLAYVQERVTAIGGSVTRARSRLGGARLVLSIPTGTPA